MILCKTRGRGFAANGCAHRQRSDDAFAVASTPGYGGVLSQGVRGAIKEIWFAVVGLPDAVPLVHLIGLPVVLQLRLCGCRTHSHQKPD